MNGWSWPWSKKKQGTEPKKTELELSNHLNELLDASRRYRPDDENSPRPEQVLIVIEEAVKDILLRTKRLEESHEKRMSQMEAEHKLDRIEGRKIQNQMILIYDYWYREVEIQKLSDQIKSAPSSMDRRILSEKQTKLIAINAGVEKGVKERSINPERMMLLRKKLGIYEEKNN